MLCDSAQRHTELNKLQEKNEPTTTRKGKGWKKSKHRKTSNSIHIALNDFAYQNKHQHDPHTHIEYILKYFMFIFKKDALAMPGAFSEIAGSHYTKSSQVDGNVCTVYIDGLLFKLKSKSKFNFSGQKSQSKSNLDLNCALNWNSH